MMLKERFKQARLQSGMTQVELSEAANSTQQSVFKIESGITNRPRNIQAFAAALNVTPEWLMYGVGGGDKPPSFINIPNYITNADDSSPDELAISTRWIADHGLIASNLAYVNINDDSMEGRIRQGDILIIDTAADTITSGQVYAIVTTDDIRVRRLHSRVDGGWTVATDNPNHPDEQISHDLLPQLQIAGKAVGMMGKL